MNILILGSGGREHAIAWKIQQSKHCTNLFVAPGNAGTASVAKNLSTVIPVDFFSVKQAVLENKIDMVIVGPEDPLVAGIVDFFKADKSIQHIPVIGPSQKGAMLEGSKDFAKEFLFRHNIPTAAYGTFTKDTVEQGKSFLETLSAPYVLKADGLAAGKGVVILENLEQAKTELEQMLVDAKFGDASSKVVIEEFLDGIELSCFVLTDGKNYKVLPTAKDYKRIGEGDTGLNTGGMGAISPVGFATPEFLEKVEQRVIKPTVEGLIKDDLDFKGFVFIGLINVDGEPFVIEYNVRLGDPETEVVLPRIKTDLVELFQGVANQSLDQVELDIDSRSATTVMLVSGGYPEAYQKGKVISGLDQVQDVLVFHAGTTFKDNDVVTNGGRVLAVTAMDDSFEQALKKSYQNIDKLCFDKINYRKDIGFDL